MLKNHMKIKLKRGNKYNKNLKNKNILDLKN